jgi:hypothetical protein
MPARWEQQVLERQQAYLVEHFALYTPTLHRFLDLFTTFDLSTPDELSALNAVIREWHQHKMVARINMLEQDRTRRHGASSSSSSPSSAAYATGFTSTPDLYGYGGVGRTDAARALQQSLLAATGTIQYLSIWDEGIRQVIRRLVIRLLTRETELRPSSADSQRSLTMPFFSSGGDAASSSRKPDPRTVADVIDAICAMWEVPYHSRSLLAFPFECLFYGMSHTFYLYLAFFLCQIPERGAAWQRAASGLAQSQLAGASILPDTTPGTIFLSPRGREQVLMGIKRCSAADVVYLGDERYRPVSPQYATFLCPDSTLPSPFCLFSRGSPPPLLSCLL